MWLSRALAGPSRVRIILTGENLQDWTADEVRKVVTALSWAPAMTVASVLLVAAAVGVTWFGPAAAQPSGAPLVRITASTGQSCGALVSETDAVVIITAPAGGPPTAIPMRTVAAIVPVSTCG